MFRKAEKVRRPIQSAKPNMKSPQQAFSPDQPYMATARMKDRNERDTPPLKANNDAAADDADALVKPHHNNHTSSPSPAVTQDSGDTAAAGAADVSE